MSLSHSFYFYFLCKLQLYSQLDTNSLRVIFHTSCWHNLLDKEIYKWDNWHLSKFLLHDIYQERVDHWKDRHIGIEVLAINRRCEGIEEHNVPPHFPPFFQNSDDLAQSPGSIWTTWLLSPQQPRIIKSILIKG